LQLIHQIVAGVVYATPLILLLCAYVFFRRRSPIVSVIRRRAFVAALFVGGLSSMVALVFSIHSLLIWNGLVRQEDIGRAYPIVTLGASGLVVFVLATFGRGIARLLLAATGLLLVLLWYFALMGSAP
jgi:hypothetical protein